MSRREEEFKHRTSIFEGAYRAWSHLGGLDPNILFDTTNKTVKDFDPIQYPLISDPRIVSTTGNNSNKKSTKVLNDDGTIRYEYPYEPLPRSGLTHPYIQAILSPWLGPNADNDAIELGLGTLRTWWQHRRKGENKSAIKILGTNKMRIVVDSYTKHFFDLAYCLIVNDHVQAPRTLHLKLKQSTTNNNYGQQHRLLGNNTCTNNNYSDNNIDDDDDDMSASIGSNNNNNNNNNNNSNNLTPLERMHLVQKNFIQNQQQSSNDSFNNTNTNNNGRIVIKGKCIPGKIDLPGIVDAVKRHANNLTYRGGGNNIIKNGSTNTSKPNKNSSTTTDGSILYDENGVEIQQYGDPNTTPILFVSSQRQYIIVMKVDGITCAHCVKIVETVLKGCSGTGKSPISGLLDAAADHNVSSVVVLIDHPNHAKRISFEAARNLSLVGYTAQCMEIQLLSLPSSDRTGNTINESNNNNTTTTTNKTNNNNNQTKTDQMIRDILQKTVYDIAKAYPVDFFDFAAPCSCPDSGVYRNNCPRHSQMVDNMFDILKDHERRVNEFLDSKRSSLLATYDNGASNTTSVTGNIPQQQMQEVNDLNGTMIQYPPSQINTTNNNIISSQVDGSIGNNYGVDDTMIGTNQQLVVEQAMMFLPNDLLIDLPGSMPIDIDPLPYYNHHNNKNDQLYNNNIGIHQQQQSELEQAWKQSLQQQSLQQQQQQHRLSLLHNNPRSNASALSSDWEVYELLHDFATSSDTITNDLQQAQQQHPSQHQQQQHSHHYEYHMDNNHEDIFQV